MLQNSGHKMSLTSNHLKLFKTLYQQFAAHRILQSVIQDMYKICNVGQGGANFKSNPTWNPKSRVVGAKMLSRDPYHVPFMSPLSNCHPYAMNCYHQC